MVAISMEKHLKLFGTFCYWYITTNMIILWYLRETLKPCFFRVSNAWLFPRPKPEVEIKFHGSVPSRVLRTETIGHLWTSQQYFLHQTRRLWLWSRILVPKIKKWTNFVFSLIMINICEKNQTYFFICRAFDFMVI